MNIYKVTGKQKPNESFWDNQVLLIVASNYANAEDKAKNHPSMNNRDIASISICGETTYKEDVFIYKER